MSESERIELEYEIASAILAWDYLEPFAMRGAREYEPQVRERLLLIHRALTRMQEYVRR